MKLKKMKWKYILPLIIIVIALIIIDQFIGVGKIQTTSMQPDLQKGDIIVYNKHASYQKDDVILIDYQGKTLVRRIIAIENDNVTIDNTKGVVSINGKEETNHDTTLSDPKGIKFPVTVSKDQYFVLCDKRKDTVDSRKIGCIHKNNIKGKIIFQLHI